MVELVVLGGSEDVIERGSNTGSRDKFVDHERRALDALDANGGTPRDDDILVLEVRTEIPNVLAQLNTQELVGPGVLEKDLDDLKKRKVTVIVDDAELPQHDRGILPVEALEGAALNAGVESSGDIGVEVAGAVARVRSQQLLHNALDEEDLDAHGLHDFLGSVPELEVRNNRTSRRYKVYLSKFAFQNGGTRRSRDSGHPCDS